MTAETLRTWKIFAIALGVVAGIVMFFSGIFPIEELLVRTTINPCTLTAAILPTDVVSLTNDNRREEGLISLSINPLLMEAAQKKANDMAAQSYYAHVSPEGKTPLYWLQNAGYKYLNAGENLVIDRTTAEQAVEAWMDSPAHRDNILRPQFTEIGVGVAEGEFEGQKTIYVVQEFGTPYPTAPTIPKIAKTDAPIRKPSTTKTITTTSESVATPATTTTEAAQAAAVVVPNVLDEGSVAISTPIAQSLPVASLVPVVKTVEVVPTSTEPTATPTEDVDFFVPLTTADPVALIATTEPEAPTGSCRS